MGATVQFIVDLESTTCCKCGVVFAFDADLMQQRRRDHQTFYCPAGHPLHFGGESDLDALKKQLRKATQAADQLRAEVTHQRDQREAAERSLRATRAAHTRTKNRIAAGVCPCCSRTFQNLGEHMANKHPTYVEEPTT
jgi:hypothetical protein